MKICPKCKAALHTDARFCLYCMTSLVEKELIKPPVRKSRRWLLVLLILVVIIGSVAAVVVFRPEPPTPSMDTTTPSATTPTQQILVPQDENTISHTVDGITYTYRPATAEDHPNAIDLHNYFTLIQVDGIAADGKYQVPSFVGNDTTLLVTAVADGAFNNTQAKIIDLGYNVRYVWGNAFGGYALTALYIHSDVYIEKSALSGCTDNTTIYSPKYVENTAGVLWSELALSYGFQWKEFF